MLELPAFSTVTRSAFFPPETGEASIAGRARITYDHRVLVLRRAGGVPRLLLFILIALMGSQFAHGACIDGPDAGIRQLQDLVNSDPNEAVKRADGLLRAAVSRSADPRAIAWLQAVRAQAFSVLELDAEARVAAAEGMKLVPDVRERVHLALMTIDAENIYDAAGIAAAMQSIEQMRAARVAGPDLDTCLLLTLGTLQYRHASSDLAIATLMQAYRAATVAENKEQRVLAADALSSVMRELGDYKQALTLNEEMVQWRRERHETLALSVAQYLRGNIFMEMREYASAAGAFSEARALSVAVRDTLGIAFSDMRICEVQIELHDLKAARQSCDSAFEIFANAKSTDMMKQTRSMLAHIDLEEGNFTSALATLNQILADGAADMPPRSVAPLFKLRARANAARRNFAAAYADLDEYSRRYTEAYEARRVRQIDGMRARFETDREIERNSYLQQELEQSVQRQGELQRRTTIAIVASALVIGLLTAMLLGASRHRRQLSALASMDALTKLPNRRHTGEVAALAITKAESANRPLTLALIDLDHFKRLNDELGHAGGDQVLREFARLSREVLRETDTFGRWGGEEFLLLMPDTSLDLALAIVERLRTRAREIKLPAGTSDLKVSLSAGLACTGPAPNSLDALVALADEALYRAKHEGRDMVQIDSASLENASSGVRRVITRR